MKKVLVTGGAGYIGSVVARQLLQNGYKVRVLDSLRFGGDSIVELLNNVNFEFQKGDILDEVAVKKSVEGVDAVIHLAAIVGDPACSKEPELAEKTNLEATKNLYTQSNEAGVSRFIFASTCSNYGKMKDPNEMITEESDLTPVSIYATTKVAAEKFLLSQDRGNKTVPTCLRFSTVYGLSPRVRFDLTVNEFVKDVALGRELVIFGEQFWRPYCHVQDLARSTRVAIEADVEVAGFDVFNVGNSTENYQKKMLVDEITKQIPEIKVSYVEKNEDPRDYRVSFEKIKTKLGFETEFDVPFGIKQINEAITLGLISEPDAQKFKNT